MMEGTNNTLLKVDGLVKHFPITRGIFRKQVGTVKAVDGISFEIKAVSYTHLTLPTTPYV